MTLLEFETPLLAEYREQFYSRQMIWRMNLILFEAWDSEVDEIRQTPTTFAQRVLQKAS